MKAILIRYLKNQYKLEKIDETYLDDLIAKNKITSDEKIEIMS